MSDDKNTETLKNSVKQSREISQWCYLIYAFFCDFEEHKDKKDDRYMIIHNNFLKFRNLPNFHYRNQGLILMLCYGLLVYPLEFWKETLKLKGYNYLKKIICEHFGTDEKVNAREFLRSLSNAIAHSHIETNIQKNSFKFWDINKGREKIF